jgi:hypothetical protein
MRVMTRRKQSASAILSLCALLAPTGGPLLAQKLGAQPPLFTGGIGPSNGQIVGVAVGIAAAGAAIGVGVYFAVKHNRAMTGCARSGADGITLTSESDKQTYTLTGEVAAIKSGNRVRVSGKKRKEKSAGTQQLLVENVSRDLGPCELASSSR